MYEIQRQIIDSNESSPEATEATTVELKQTKDMTVQKQKHSTHIYQQSKSLKQIQELVTILKSVSNGINERRVLVKNFVIMTE